MLDSSAVETDNLATRVEANGPLYSTRQVGVASFLGGPIAACWLIANNADAFDERQTARNCRFGGFVATLVLGIVVAFLPENFPSSALPAGYTALFYYVSQNLYGERYRAHVDSGGARRTWATTVGLGLVSLLITVALLFGVVFLLMSL